MLKKDSVFVLASLRGSTYRLGKEPVAGSGRAGEIYMLRLQAPPAHHLAGAHKRGVTYS